MRAIEGQFLERKEIFANNIYHIVVKKSHALRERKKNCICILYMYIRVRIEEETRESEGMSI